MDNGQQALLFFYGVFWATVISSTSPYRAFATTLAIRGNKKAILRLVFATVLLNILPVLLIHELYKCKEIVPADSSATAIMAAAFASLSVFGINRVFHALVCSKETWKYFYTEVEIKKYDLDNEEKSMSPWSAHLIPGIAYLLGMPGLAWLITSFF